MRLNKKNKKKIIIAVILGGVALFTIFNSMNSQKAVMNEMNQKLAEQNKVITNLKQNPLEAEADNKKVDVVIAAQDIKVGDVLTVPMLKTASFNEKDLPEDYFSTTAMVVGKKTGKNITAGQFVTAADIQMDDLSAIEIPNDTRAISIPVDKFKGLASYIKVGAKVDLLKASDPSKDDSSSSASSPEFIAQNIKVVGFEMGNALATAAPATTGTTKINPQYLSAVQASAITFLIPLNLVTKVINAMSEGQLEIVTRNGNDFKTAVTEKELPAPPSALGSDDELPPPPLSEEGISSKGAKNTKGSSSMKKQLASAPDTEDEDIPPPQMPAAETKKIELIKGGGPPTIIEFNSDDTASSSSGNGKAPATPSDDLSKLKELVNMAK